MKTPSYLALVFLMAVAVGASLAVHARSAVRSPDDTGGWMLNGLALQRVSSSYDAREWVYLVHFNACFEAGSGKAPRCFACRSSLTAAFRPAPSIPLCFVRWRTPCIRERARPPGSIIRQ